MGKKKSVAELTAAKEKALKNLDSYLDSLINNETEENRRDLKKKADLICYWINDYIYFLNKEQDFDPKLLKQYKRGDIVKVDFGFRIGCEHGGRHYAIVLDNDNNRASPVVTVVPLTSVKPSTNLNKLHKGDVYLGDEIYNSVKSKADSLFQTIFARLYETHEQQEKIKSQIIESENKLTELKNRLDDEFGEEFIEFEKELELYNNDRDDIERKHNEIKQKIEETEKELELVKKIIKEIEGMKQGSIALVNQVVTVSKLRIRDPRTSFDVLAGIKLSGDNLDKIDKELMLSFTKSSQRDA
ncbi:MAG: type II toxin-antitoxin system PemK/MazF family toxin [Oscillospiraceae bacterium]